MRIRGLLLGLGIALWTGPAASNDSLLDVVMDLAMCGVSPCEAFAVSRDAPLLSAGEHPPWNEIRTELRAPWCAETCSVASTWVTRLPDGEFVKVSCCLGPGQIQLIAPEEKGE